MASFSKKILSLRQTMILKWNRSEKPLKHPREFGHLAPTTYLLVLAVSVACIFLHMLLGRPAGETTAAQWAHMGQELLKEVGFAGVVAFLLIITIDGFSRKQHERNVELLTDKINKNLFEVIFKNKIPGELYEVVRTQLLESKVIRRDFDACYSFSKLSTPEYNKEWLRMEVIHTYTLENISSEDVKAFRISNTIDIPNVPKLQELCKILSIKIGDNEISIDEIAKIDPKKHFLKYSVEIDVPAGSRVKVKLHDERITRMHDSNVLCAIYPTIDLRLTVNVPSGDLSVAADSLHAKDLEPRAVPQGGTMFQWQLPGGLLPYQGVYFQWRPCVDEAANKDFA